MTNASSTPASPAPDPALAALLAEAERDGLRLRPTAGGGLAIGGQPSPGLLDRLRAHKAALAALLRGRATEPSSLIP